ncbi:hypothetical protein NE865_07966 [Phthorimaea operculella]|nr:hypothetical protein NE865_07966 [Phthorimaea operculella]
MADIAALVSARGYVKGQITRLHKFLETPEFEKASASLLQTKKELLVSTFKDYVSYNMKIALVKPDDAEDAGKQEEKYCETLARINDEIDAKKKASGAEGVHAPMAHTKLPNIEIPTFTEFLQKKAMVLESVDCNGARPVRAAVNVTVEERPQQRQCPFCKYNKEFHKLFACPKFKLAPVKERMQFVNENKLCRVCLGAHQGRCKYHFRCQTCKKTSHSTLLHEDSPAVNLCMKEESQVVMMAQDDKNDLSLLPTVKVKLIRSDGTEMIIKAGLDSFSQVSLVTSQVVQALGLKPKHSSTEIVGVAISTKTNVHFVRLFCDSKIVLAWIRTQVTQLNAYVANRVQVVTQLTAEWTWHYIPTSDNPADLITRGVSPQELGDSALWWSGPSFLQNDKYEYVSTVDLPTSLPETKKAQAEESIHSHVALPAVVAANDLFERWSHAPVLRHLHTGLRARRSDNEYELIKRH